MRAEEGRAEGGRLAVRGAACGGECLSGFWSQYKTQQYCLGVPSRRRAWASAGRTNKLSHKPLKKTGFKTRKCKSA
jgi:hypothetical protein